MYRATLITTLILILTASAAPVGAAAVIEGIAFQETYRAGATELQLKGTGLLRYMIFIKAYVGAFYMLPGETPQNALGATPRRLELEYFHAIAAADFAEATTQKINDNVSPESMALLEGRLETFNAMYRDVRPGDRYALTYLPGRGTELSLNGQSLGRIPGDDFATAVFAIWLGQSPIDKTFRDHLLGLR